MMRSAVALKPAAEEVGGTTAPEVKHEVVAFPGKPGSSEPKYTGSIIQHQRPQYATPEMARIAMQQQQACI